MAFERGRIVDDHDDAVLFAAATRPIGYRARLRGLVGRSALGPDQAWWFTRCAAVHTLGMRFAIDVVHLDAAGKVVRIHPALKPARWSAAIGGRHVIELAAGAAARVAIHTGQVLRFRT